MNTYYRALSIPLVSCLLATSIHAADKKQQESKKRAAYIQITFDAIRACWNRADYELPVVLSATPPYSLSYQMRPRNKTSDSFTLAYNFFPTPHYIITQNIGKRRLPASDPRLTLNSVPSSSFTACISVDDFSTFMAARYLQTQGIKNDTIHANVIAAKGRQGSSSNPALCNQQK